ELVRSNKCEKDKHYEAGYLLGGFLVGFLGPKKSKKKKKGRSSVEEDLPPGHVRREDYFTGQRGLEYVINRNQLDYNKASEVLHQIKDNRLGNSDVAFDKFGNIIEPSSGEILGNLGSYKN